MKTLFILALVALCSCLHAVENDQATAADELPALIRKAEKGVFFIRLLNEKKQIISAGTGMLLDRNGSVLTSLHLFRPANLSVVPTSGEALDVNGNTFAITEITAFDEALDLVIMKLDKHPAEAVPLELGDARPPTRGSRVLVLGHPQGFRFVSSDGIISAVNKTKELPETFLRGGCVKTGPDVVWIQTSAAVSPGNSGGPMIDAKGKAIGIIQWMSRAGGAMNFALHIEPVRKLIEKPPIHTSIEEFTRGDGELGKISGEIATACLEYSRQQHDLGFSSTFSTGKSESKPKLEHPAIHALPKLLALAKAYRDSRIEFEALQMLFSLSCSRSCPDAMGGVVEEASKRMIEAYRDDKGMLRMIESIPLPALQESCAFLKNLSNASANHEIKAKAAFLYARSLDADPDLRQHLDEAIRFAGMAASVDPALTMYGNSLSEAANQLLDKLKHAVAGCRAPDIGLKDQTGTTVSVEAFKGHYLLVVFWQKKTEFMGSIPKSIDQITKRYAGSPLRIIGIRDDTGDSPSKTNEPDPKEWQLVTEKDDCRIGKAWYVDSAVLSPAPTAFIIDPDGVIIKRISNPPSDVINLGYGVLSNYRYSSFSSSSGQLGDSLAKALDCVPAIAETRAKIETILSPNSRAGDCRVLNSTAGQPRIQKMAQYGMGKWRDDDHLYWSGATPGAKLNLSLSIVNAGTFDVVVFLTKAMDYGIVHFELDGQKIGGPVDLYNPSVIPSGAISLGTHDLSAGAHKLCVEIIGANDQALKSHMFGLDHINLKEK